MFAIPECAEPATDAGFTPLAPSNLPDLIADRIIEAVARRRLLPGQRLIETELSEQLQVSRIPLREALRVLQSQGIVLAQPRRGVRLIAFDDDWARALYDIRVALERLSSHTVAALMRAEGEARNRLDAAILQLEIVAEGGDVFALNAADLALHGTIYDLSGNPLLQTLWSAMARHVLVLFSMETYRIADARRVVAEHHVLRRVLLGGSAADIDAMVAAHVAGAGSLDANVSRTSPLRPASRRGRPKFTPP